MALMPLAARSPGAAPDTTPFEKPVTIMPLGDSITEGGASFCCYRLPLWEKLRTGGYLVDYVGTRSGPSRIGPLRHEGYGGKTVEFLAANIERLYRANPADIVLLHAGHNHFAEQKPIEGILAATEKIVTTVHAIRPEATVLVAQVIPSGKLPKYSYIPELNARLAGLVQRLVQSGQRVALVNQAKGFDWRTDTVSDLVHPNARGAEKMAARWYEALVKTLNLLKPMATAKAVEAGALKTASKRDVTIFKEPGRYGGWPANHGLWQWGDELVVGFTSTWFKHAESGHAVDRSRTSEEWQARSLDGGLTWKVESQLPFANPKTEARPRPLTEPIDFTHPDFALMFRFGSLHAGPSWFYVSYDRCRNWRGPYAFAVEGIDRIATRTDLVVLGQRDCLMLGGAAKANGKEGRVFCARTTDGGLHWKLLSRIGPEPPGFAIMPSTVRLAGGALLTTIRHGDPGLRYNIDAWRSDDGGAHWSCLGDATPDIGGNPPSLVKLKDGRLCLTYGYRKKPYGVRARLSGDEGRTWGPEIILRDDGLTGDLGYPRSIVRPDGRVLTIYYFNGPRDEDRTIEGTLWTPPAAAPRDK